MQLIGRYLQRHFRIGASVAAMVFVDLSFAMPDIDSIVPSHVVSSRCDVSRDWTLHYVAGTLGLGVDETVKLKLVRGLSNLDICTMPEARLRRAILRSGQPKPDHPAEAAKYRESQRRERDGYVDPAGLHNALVRRDAMLTAQSKEQAGGIAPQDAGIGRGSWTALGPGNIGGRVRAIATVPGQPATLYLGSVGGGLWKTTDAGTTWNPLNGFSATLPVSSIVLHPENPDLMWVGTGEGFYNGDALRGFGIYKSVDGGQSWFHVAATAPTSNSDWYTVNRLAIAQGAPWAVFAATNGGLYRSINLGETWSRVSTRRTLDVRVHPTARNRVLAGHNDGSVSYSNDGGQSFTNIRVPSSALDGANSWGRVEIAWAGTTTRAYASVSTSGTSTGDGRLFMSDDGGASWVSRSSPFHLAGQGWYNNTLWVDPTNENYLLFGGLDNFRSTDGGLTSSRVSRWYCAPRQAHADNHTIVAASNFNGTNVRTVYWGNDGGIYRASNVDNLLAQSGNASCANDGWTALNSGLTITQFYGVAAHPSNAAAIYGGTQDNGSLRWSGSGTTWDTVFGGDGGASAVDPTDANYMYGEYVYASLHRSTNGTATTPTADWICNGLTDASAYCGAEHTSEANFIAPFAMDPGNSGTLYAGAKRLWRTTNAKATTPTWAIARAQAAYRDPNQTTDNYWTYVSAVAIAANDSNVIYNGHNDGRVFYTRNASDGSPTWTEIVCAAQSYPPWRSVLRIVIDPANNRLAYVGHGGYNTANLWRLDTTGATPTCTSIGGALPSSPVRAIARHPTQSSWLYAGTEVGLFASENLGTTWKAASDGPANVAVEELVWQNENQLIASTHSRGVFRATINTTGCTYALSSPRIAAPRSGGQIVVSVSATLSTCSWSASTATPWLAVQTAGGSGSAVVSFNVSANTSVPRSATATVAGIVLHIDQAGDDMNCNLDIDGDLAFSAATDGVLLARYAMGIRGLALTQGLSISSQALRKTHVEIEPYIAGRRFDLNGDGNVGLSDALIGLRAIRGISGVPLSAGAVSNNPSAFSAQEIDARIPFCKK